MKGARGGARWGQEFQPGPPPRPYPGGGNGPVCLPPAGQLARDAEADVVDEVNAEQTRTPAPEPPVRLVGAEGDLVYSDNE